MQRVTLKQVAAQAGVSLSTASQALRGAGRISAATRARIRSAATELNYQPDPALSALADYRSAKTRRQASANLAFLIFPRHAGEWGPKTVARRLYEAARAAAADLGYALELFDLNAYPRIATSARILEARGVRGLLVPFHRNREDLHRLPLDRFALVELGYAAIAHPSIDRVTMNDFRAMQMAWRELSGRGYRRIGLVLAGSTNANSGGAWEAAYLHEQQKAARERGLAVLEVLRDSLSGTDGTFVFQRWYREERPDAIIARKSLRPHLDALGLAAPDDVGYANLGVPDERSATSGTIFDPVEISRNAVGLLDQALRRNQVGIPEISRTLLLEPRWNEGRTLRKP